MIKIVYPNGAVLSLIRGKRFIINPDKINVYDDNDKLIGSFYKTDGLGVVEEMQTLDQLKKGEKK